MHPYGDCYYCGGTVKEKKVDIDYRWKGELFILNKVPAGVCVQCGEKYFKAEVVKRMEGTVKKRKNILKTLEVPVLGLINA